MKVRQVDTSDADQISAALFFDMLAGFYDMTNWDVLDAFARNGQLTVSKYIDGVARTDCWELGEEHREALIDLGAANVEIGCSYSTVHLCDEQYDMIVVDTPQGAHKDSLDRVHFEHFDFLRMMYPLMKSTCMVVVYVNRKPYHRDDFGSHGYDEYDEYDFENWMIERKRFYGQLGSSKFYLPEEHAIQAYRTLFNKLGLQITRMFMVPCHSDVPGLEPYAMRLGLELKRMAGG